jgi:UDP-N-acetylglucosamine:LPS N-acetylglucosamine transferase
MSQRASPGPGRRVIVTITGGGFFWQSRAVAQALGEDFELHYVTPEDPAVWNGRGLPPGEFHAISSLTTMADRSVLRKIVNLLRTIRRAARIVGEVRPYAVICVATSLAIPLFVAARLRGARTVFVESITRVSTPSTTGRILTRLRLCDRFYVQWPEAERLYAGAVYRGTVL